MKKMTRLELDTRIAKLSRWDWIALLLAVLIGGMLATLSVARYRGYNASMSDIGNMSQAIWSATQGQPLEYTHEDGTFSRLAWHIEVIYFLIAPLYALFPDPRTLLISQAVLFALGAIPVYRMAWRHFGDRWIARALMLCYLLYPTAQTAVLFDFHGDTLALPLLLFVLDAFERRAWRRYVFWVGLALLCKFYVALPVAAWGMVLWLRGWRRTGFLTVLLAAGWGAFAFFVIGPAFTPSGVFQAHLTPFSYLTFYFGHLREWLLPTAFPRLLTAFIVFVPALWLGWRAALWLFPAVAIALPALVSVGDVAAYGYRFHHYALTVPFLLYAVIVGAETLRRHAAAVSPGKRMRAWRAELFFTLALVFVFNVGLVDTPLNPQFWLGKPGWGINQWRYGHISRDTFKDHWLRENVPARVPLAASEFLAPHLTNRETLYLVRYPDELKMLGQPDHLRQTLYLMRHPDALPDLLLTEHLNEVDYVVADALYDYTFLFGEDLMIGGVLHDIPGIMAVMQEPEFGLLTARDGLLLFGRVPDSMRVLTQAVTVGGGAVTDPQTCFADQLCLLSAEIEPRGGRRFLLQYRWVATPALNTRVPLLAVSRLEGVDHSRVVHLPTLALHPTLAWEAGQVVEETFEVVWSEEIPAGDYRLLTGWYDGGDPFAAATDAQTRVGEEVYVGTVALH